MADAIRITGGRVLDPSRGLDAQLDVLVRGGRIVEVAPSVAREGEEIRARGLWVVPGLIDMHVHFREPGGEEVESLETGCRAAVAGGFTAVACMANTPLPLDDPARVGYVRLRAAELGLCRVYPVGAVTRGLRGEQLADMAAMADAGAVAFSDDGHPVRNSLVLRRALEYARMLDRPILSHCEDPDLAGPFGVMHEGPVSLELGLEGIPSEAEEIAVLRDAVLARMTGGRLHVCHVSTRGAVEAIRRARREGVRISAEATPHHLTLSDRELASFDGRFKMNPPLRSEEDVAALVEALADGTIEAIATDHAPHTEDQKERDLAEAPFGVVGLETATAVVLTHLVHTGKISPLRAIEALSTAPARTLGVPGGTLAPGSPADITLVDPGREWVCDSRSFASKGRATPFEGMRLRGRAAITIVAGKVVFSC